jgi:hypothetical protein
MAEFSIFIPNQMQGGTIFHKLAKQNNNNNEKNVIGFCWVISLRI